MDVSGLENPQFDPLSKIIIPVIKHLNSDFSEVVWDQQLFCTFLYHYTTMQMINFFPFILIDRNSVLLVSKAKK